MFLPLFGSIWLLFQTGHFLVSAGASDRRDSPLHHFPPTLSVFVCHCDFACVFLPLKSCYQTQQTHCSPPIQPPWHNSPWPLAHMTLPHCCLPLLLARPWLASERQKACTLAPSGLSIVHCWQVSEYVTKTKAVSRGGLGRNLARQIAGKRKVQLVFLLLPSSSSSLFLPSWLIVWLRLTKEDSLKKE